MPRSLLVAAMACVACVAALPATAHAHPLGNFSVNHLAQVSVSADRVAVRYVLDEAEIPTFQQRGVPEAELLARKRAEVRRHLVLTVDGRRVALRPAGRATLSHPDGQGGLTTTRVEIPLAAAVRDPRRVVVRDGTFAGRVGWKAIVARPGRGTAVRASVPAGDPTGGLRRYPQGVLDSPADVREARFDVRPGPGTLVAADGERRLAGGHDERAGDGLTTVFSDAASGRGVLVLLLLAAFGWGAVHALSPGHGKAMVAAYLVGTRGTPRQAVALGAIVTATHTVGVFTLGAVTLALSAYVLPETLYPWLNLVSGLLVVGIGAAVLRANLRRHHARRRAGSAGAEGHDCGHHHHGLFGHHHEHGPGHDHGDLHGHDHGDLHGHDHGDLHGHDHGDLHGHDHGDLHGHDHGDDRGHRRGHDHGHRHDRGDQSGPGAGHGHDHGDHPGQGHHAVGVGGQRADHHPHTPAPGRQGRRGLLAMGAAAGLIPCPSALVVLLGAIAQGQVALGMLLIVAFSAGLAATLTALGLAVVLATRLVRRMHVPSGLVTALPAASAVLIVVVGCVLTARALPLVAG